MSDTEDARGPRTRVRMRRPARPWTLRRRLVLGTVALLAVLSVVIGAVSALAVNSALRAKLDEQVTSAVQRVLDTDRRAATGAAPFGFGTGPIPGGGGLGPGALSATIVGGRALGTVQTDSIEDANGGLGRVSLSDAEVRALLDVSTDGRPQTISLGSLGPYRVAAGALVDGRVVLLGLPLSEVTTTVAQVVLIIALVVILGVAVAVLAGLAIIRSAVRPLERVTATASHVSELPLARSGVALEARVPEADADDRTEVGRVGAAINRMLGHIAGALALRDASEGKLRTFVADASHELRTPLASIRGYAELTRRSGHELPEDVVRALARIESESQRMTSIVEDLLLLARLDDGRELEKHPVDLVALLRDAVSDAYAAGQDHEWELDAPDGRVLVIGDAPRLHQVAVNLLANARVHTPAGSHVVAAVTTEGGAARFTVADDGPGIAPDILPSVFERFVRGDGSRARVGGGSGSGSTGLGLAIVSAVVAAHDGTVAVESEPGRTAFSVTLPLAPNA